MWIAWNVGMHQSRAGLLVNLAILEGQRGEHQAAEGLLQRALALREGTQGRDHPETVTVLNNLSTTLLELDRDDEALAANDEALARRSRACGGLACEGRRTLGILIARGLSRARRSARTRRLALGSCGRLEVDL